MSCMHVNVPAACNIWFMDSLLVMKVMNILIGCVRRLAGGRDSRRCRTKTQTREGSRGQTRVRPGLVGKDGFLTGSTVQPSERHRINLVRLTKTNTSGYKTQIRTHLPNQQPAEPICTQDTLNFFYMHRHGGCIYKGGVLNSVYCAYS
jgi:hypothetical protein